MSIAWWLAEFIGTFTLVFIGAGSVLNNVGLLGIAIAHGLAIGVMVSAVGHISGGKLNPAVTLGFLFGGKVSIKNAAFEIVAQLAGAVAAAYLLSIIFPTSSLRLATPQPGAGVSPAIAVLTEAIMTFLLVFVVYATAIDPRGAFKSIAGLGIGGVILFDILMGANITGAAINPARAFGPALVSQTWNLHYVYWAGPVIGGILAGIFYMNLMTRR